MGELECIGILRCGQNDGSRNVYVLNEGFLGEEITDRLSSSIEGFLEGDGAGFDVGADEVDGGFEGRAGAEDGGDSTGLHGCGILIGDGATEDDEDVFGVLLAE